MIEIVLETAEGVMAAGPAEARLWVRHQNGEQEELAAQAAREGRLVARDLPLDTELGRTQAGPHATKDLVLRGW